MSTGAINGRIVLGERVKLLWSMSAVGGIGVLKLMVPERQWLSSAGDHQLHRVDLQGSRSTTKGSRERNQSFETPILSLSDPVLILYRKQPGDNDRWLAERINADERGSSRGQRHHMQLYACTQTLTN